MKFITMTDSAGISRQIRTKHIQTVEGDTTGQSRVTLLNGSMYFVKHKPIDLDNSINDVIFLHIASALSPARVTLVNIDAVLVIEKLTSEDIKTNYPTALSMRSGHVIMSDRIVADVENEIILLHEHFGKES